MSDLLKLARQRIDDTERTHWDGCERDHRECLIQRMADEIERLQDTRQIDAATLDLDDRVLLRQAMEFIIAERNNKWRDRTTILAALRERLGKLG